MFFGIQNGSVVTTEALMDIRRKNEFFEVQMQLAQAERVGLHVWLIASDLDEGVELCVDISTSMEHGDEGDYFASHSVHLRCSAEGDEENAPSDSELGQMEDSISETFASDLYHLTDDWDIEFKISRALLEKCPEVADGALIYRTLFPSSAESLQRRFDQAKDALSAAEKAPATTA